MPTLRECDEILRQRVVLHDFGLVWQSTDRYARFPLAEEEPELFDRNWDAFLAAYVAHLCEQDGIEQADASEGQAQQHG